MSREVVEFISRHKADTPQSEPPPWTSAEPFSDPTSTTRHWRQTEMVRNESRVPMSTRAPMLPEYLSAAGKTGVNCLFATKRSLYDKFGSYFLLGYPPEQRMVG